MKICIYGGSFDPVHNGHIHFINEVEKKIEIDKFIIVPANISPLKQNVRMAKNSDRLKMLEIGLIDHQNCIIDDYEMKKGGISYSINTVEKMIKKYGEKNEYYFLIGSDNLQVIKKWKDYKKLLQLVKFIVVPRNNFNIYEIDEDIISQVLFVYLKEFDISSTEIRKAVANGENILNYVQKSVGNYIEENGLYK